MPSPRKDETQNKFISRCMSDEEAKRSFPNSKQRVAFCNSQWENKSRSSGAVLCTKTLKLVSFFIIPEVTNFILFI